MRDVPAQGGGILAVVPGQLGIGVFSPPLDARGNSVRGIRVCTELSNRYGLHIFEPGGDRARLAGTLAAWPSQQGNPMVNSVKRFGGEG